MSAEKAAATDAPLLLAAEDLVYRHGDDAVVDHVSLSIHAGEIVTVIGPNGGGKSTLMRIVLGILRPHGGTIWRQRGLRIGYAPQFWMPDATLPLSVRRFLLLSRHARRGQIAAIAADVGIEELLDRPLQKLSGGQRQRVLLGRALMGEPDLLVLDEPLQNVDVSGQSALYKLIADLRNRKGFGVLMVSHDLHLVMAESDTVLCMNRHICCQGRPEAVSASPEYGALFGFGSGRHLGVYTHHHDHDHDDSGRCRKIADRAEGGQGGL